MKTRQIVRLVVLAVAMTFCAASHAYGDCKISSFGVSGTTSFPPPLADFGVATAINSTVMTAPPQPPPSGTVQVFHMADGLYIYAVISDKTINPQDAVNFRFDLNGDGGANPNGDDFGVVILRNDASVPKAQWLSRWGPADVDPSNWGQTPDDLQVANVTDVNGLLTSWTVMFHLPTTNPVSPAFNLSFSQNIGFYVNFVNADNAFGGFTAEYTQWPGSSDTTDDDTNPSTWGTLCFDPKTTFAHVSVVGVRNTAPVGNRSLSRTALNSFEVQLSNAGGTVIPNASNVRVNLYLAAKGIGEPWHRMDTIAQLTSDCTNSAWNPDPPPQRAEVCNGPPPGAEPLPDIENVSVDTIVANTGKYTINDGVTLNGAGTAAITVTPGTPAGAPQVFPVLDWQLSSGQLALFDDPVTASNGATADRAHECMLAKAIVPNDPDPSSHTLQINLDFVPLIRGKMKTGKFSIGHDGFAKYDPNVGKPMFLQVSRQNMDNSFQFDLTGVQQLPGGGYRADLIGTDSLQVAAQITATSSNTNGTVLKQNLMVPPKAGAEIEHGCNHHWWCAFSWFVELLEGRDTEEPVYVRVQPNSTVWIVNYMLDDKDVQYVKVDPDGPLPRNGPIGLSPSQVSGNRGKLLVPNARVGELVLSFDNFQTGVGIGQGAQVRVPPGVNYLALAVNDSPTKSQHHKGTGFRVMISDHQPVIPATAKRTSAKASAEVIGEVGGIDAVPIADVLPQVCVNGYEDTGQKRPLGNQQYELFRFIGNVCWTITNVLPEVRPPEDNPDNPPQDEWNPHPIHRGGQKPSH